MFPLTLGSRNINSIALEANMRHLIKFLMVALIAAGLIGFAQPASAQLGGLKKKVKEQG